MLFFKRSCTTETLSLVVRVTERRAQRENFGFGCVFARSAITFESAKQEMFVRSFFVRSENN